MLCGLRHLGAFVLLPALLGALPTHAQQPLRIGVMVFLSGPAAGSLGVPARNAVDLLAEALNKGSGIPGYEKKKGFGGRQLELVYVDEAGGPAKAAAEYRSLVERQNIDVVLGLITSGDCLAIAPVAEELKKLTVLIDCATSRIFEEGGYKYVFRTTTTATHENVAAARYLVEQFPELKQYSGINPNYTWGQDAWSDFTEAMKQLKPKVQVAANVTPKLGAGQYGGEISTLLDSNAGAIHNSLWGGDLEAYIIQAAPRGLLAKVPNIMITGETIVERFAEQLPDGTIIGARGPNGPFAPPTALNKWFSKTYRDRFGVAAVYVSYHMANAVFGVKSAYEKAMAANKGKEPSIDDVIKTFEYLEFESPAGVVKMVLGRGHQAAQPVPYGTVKKVDGKITLINVKYYPPEQISPPDGIKSLEWIRAGFKRK